MSCLAKGCLDEDRETAEKENAPAQKRLDPQRDNENGHDRHEEEGCCGESGIGEEHAEEVFGDIYDNTHCAISINGRRSTDAVMRPTPRNIWTWAQANRTAIEGARRDFDQQRSKDGAAA